MVPESIKTKIDEVRKSKIQIEILSEEVEKQSAEIKEYMKTTGEKVITTDTSSALFFSKPAGLLDPQKTYEALKRKLQDFFLIVTVRKGTTKDNFGADYFLGKAALDELVTSDKTIDVLRITALKEEVPKKARA